MIVRLPPSLNRSRVLEAAALIMFAGPVIVFVHAVVPYIVDRL